MNLETPDQKILDVIFEQEFGESYLFKDESSFFEFFAAKQILKRFDLNDEEINSGIIGGSNDGGCDGIFFFVNGILITEDIVEQLTIGKEPLFEFVIIQAKRVNSFSEAPIQNWKTTIKNLLPWDSNVDEFAARYSESVRDSFKNFHDVYKKSIRSNPHISVNFFYCTFAKEVHPNVQAQANELEAIVKELYPSQNTKANVSFYDAKRLVEAFQSSPNLKFTLNFSENPIQKENAFIALVNLGEFYKFITNNTDHIQPQLFESNIRDYQGRVQVNQDIQKTLSSESNDDFWWFNNGITIVADEADIVSIKIMTLTEPSIVNGLQTSNEVFNYFWRYPERLSSEQRNILVRVIIPSDDVTRDRIILATNNQTSIPKASLRVNDPIHWHIEQYLKSKGLFYDRRKNYYKNQGKNPSDIISVPFLSQCLMTLVLKKPDFARARPSTLLTDETEYNALFPSNIDLDGYYKVAYLGKEIERILKSSVHYTASQKNDLLFYVLYYSVANTLKRTSFDFEDIIHLNLEAFNEEYIYSVTEIVYGAYEELGGNGRTAKGPNLRRKLDEIINAIHETGEKDNVQ